MNNKEPSVEIPPQSLLQRKEMSWSFFKLWSPTVQREVLQHEEEQGSLFTVKNLAKIMSEQIVLNGSRARLSLSSPKLYCVNVLNVGALPEEDSILMLEVSEVLCADNRTSTNLPWKILVSNNQLKIVMKQIVKNGDILTVWGADRYDTLTETILCIQRLRCEDVVIICYSKMDDQIVSEDIKRRRVFDNKYLSAIYIDNIGISTCLAVKLRDQAIQTFIVSCSAIPPNSSIHPRLIQTEKSIEDGGKSYMKQPVYLSSQVLDSQLSEDDEDSQINIESNKELENKEKAGTSSYQYRKSQADLETDEKEISSKSESIVLSSFQKAISQTDSQGVFEPDSTTSIVDDESQTTYLLNLLDELGSQTKTLAELNTSISIVSAPTHRIRGMDISPSSSFQQIFSQELGIHVNTIAANNSKEDIVKVEPEEEDELLTFKRLSDLTGAGIFNLKCTVTEMFEAEEGDNNGYIIVEDGTIPTINIQTETNEASQKFTFSQFSQNLNNISGCIIMVKNFSDLFSIVSLGSEFMLCSVQVKEISRNSFQLLLDGKQAAKMIQSIGSAMSGL